MELKAHTKYKTRVGATVGPVTWDGELWVGAATHPDLPCAVFAGMWRTNGNADMFRIKGHPNVDFDIVSEASPELTSSQGGAGNG